MTKRHTYVRPMQGWWRRDPFFMRYMAREATAIFVYLYGIVLVIGLVALRNGAAAFDAWLAWLRHPLGIAFQLVALAVFAYHTWSWFEIMPKTMPPVIVGGRKLAPGLITTAGLAAAAVASFAFLAFAKLA